MLSISLEPTASVLSESIGGLLEDFAIISREGDTSAALTVLLESNDTSEIQVPESVIIPAGQSSISLDAYLLNDGEIDGSQTVTIVATDSEGILAGNSANVEVADDDAAGALTIGGRVGGVLASGDYDVLTSLKIEEGDTWTISPGTTLKFAASTSLSIYGTLLAIGTEAEPIVFTSAAETPAVGDWGGIGMYKVSGDRSELEHVEISYATRGIGTSNTNPKLSITSSDIHDCEKGLSFSVSSSEYVDTDDVIIRATRIHHNVIGVFNNAWCYASSSSGNSSRVKPLIIDSEIDNNQTGIQSTADANTGYGLIYKASAGAGVDIIRCKIHSNTKGVLFGPVETSEYANGYTTGRICDSIIVGNTEYGIKMQSDDYSCGVDVINNLITENLGPGIAHESTYMGNMEIRNNIITENEIGIQSGGFTPDDGQVANNIVWANTTSDWLGYSREYGTFCQLNATGNPTDAGGNILLDPQLGDWADNGGRWQTRLPLYGSPVVNAGTATVLTSRDYDLRGEASSRVIFDTIDIGPIETQDNGQYIARGDLFDEIIDGSISGDVIVNDLYTGSGTYEAVEVTAPQSGVLALNTDGSFTYTPEVGFIGVDSFQYHVAINGTETSNATTVSLLVLPADGNIVISSITDEADGTMTDGNLSLREALLLASMRQGTDTIVFAESLASQAVTLDPEVGEVFIGSDVTLSGPSAGKVTIDAAGNSRVFFTASDNINISGLIITGGQDSSGAGVYRSSGLLTITDCEIINNTATGSGGGIYNSNHTSGSIEVIDSVLSNNHSEGRGGGLYNPDAEATFSNCKINNNTASEGGGVYSTGYYSDFTVLNTQIHNNMATTTGSYRGGGAIHNGERGKVDLDNVSILGNYSSSYAGGIYCDERSYTYLTNVTLVGNSSGIYAYEYARVYIKNSSISGNASYTASGLSDSYWTINNSIIFHNQSDTVPSSHSGSNNLFGVDPGFVRNPSDGGDGWGDDPATTDVDESLNDDYGDLRLTDMSIALDAGNGTIGNIETDLDGNPRIFGERVDLGAYEFQGAPNDNREMPSLTVTTSSDIIDPSDNEISLREAILYSAFDYGNGTITFNEAIDGGTIALNGSQLLINDDVTINASNLNDITIDANQLSRVFFIGTAEVTLSDLNITGGASDRGGGICSYYGTVLVINSTISNNSVTGAYSRGGGVYIGDDASLSINNSVVSNNTATGSSAHGGGIYNYYGTISISDSAIRSNSASSNGGGVCSDGSSSVTINGTTISDNSSGNTGGGIYAYRWLTVTNSILTSNSSRIGGGIRSEYGPVKILYSEISLNDAEYRGGVSNSDGDLAIIGSKITGNASNGVYNYGDEVTITNSTISGNHGSGIYHNSSSTMTIDNSIVTLNGGSINGTYIGSNNLIDLDPAFVISPSAGMDETWGTADDIQGDYHLSPTSPAVNTGDDALAVDLSGNPLTTDIEGNPRIVGGKIDIGAYENQDPANHIPVMEDIPSQEINEGDIFTYTVDVTDGNAPPQVLVYSLEVAPAGAVIDSATGTITWVTDNSHGRTTPYDFTVRVSDGEAYDEESFALLVYDFQKYVVDSLADTIAIDGELTLREAIEASSMNAASGDALAGSNHGIDVITFAPELFTGGSVMITLGGEELAVDDRLVLQGPGAELLTINANQASRVFNITGSEVAISGLTISGGSAYEGGGIYLSAGNLTLLDSTISNNTVSKNGGGILNRNSTLAITGCTITNNSAGSGGGISNFSNNGSAILTIDASTISENTSTSSGGGIYNYRYSGSATMEIDNCTISDNATVSYGGGIYNDGTLTITNSAISGNTTTSSSVNYYGGGGIANKRTLLVDNSIISNNTSAYNGGGIYTDYGSVKAIGTVISGNSAKNGGGISSYKGSVEVVNTTVSGNVATNGDGIVNNYGTLTVDNSIVAMNAGDEIVGAYSGSNNLLSVNPGFLTSPSAGTDGVWGTSDDVQGDYHLTGTSIALNVGDNALAIDANGDPLTVDIEGNSRIVEGTVDIGAYEYQSAPDPGRETPSLVVTSTGDGYDMYDGKITLREAIYYWEFLGTDTGTITFDAALNGSTITLEGSQLCITEPVTIDASTLTSLTIDATEQSRVFYINANDATLSGLTITGGSAYQGGGIYLDESSLELIGCTITANTADDDGGGIYNDYSTLTVEDSTISDNLAEDGSGGGIYNYAYDGAAILIVDESAITGNASGGAGGGIYGYHYTGSISMTIENSVITNNSTEAYGGGIYNDGALTITNSTISGNWTTSTSSGNYGGGGISNKGSLTVINSTISDNVSAYNGGGILNGYYSHSGSLKVIGSVISGNSAKYGGGIRNGNYATTSIVNSTISANSAISGDGVSTTGTLTVNNSIVAMNAGDDILGTYSGSSNLLSVDPGFVISPSAGTDGVWGTSDDVQGDYHLTGTSIALNVGDNALAIDANGDPLTVDIEGNSRIVEGTVDIGAYELQFTASVPDTSITSSDTVLIPIAVYGGSLVSGFGFSARLTGGTGTPPTITNVDLLGTAVEPTIWYGLANPPFGVDISPDGTVATAQIDSLDLENATANGVLAYVTIDTNGCDAGGWTIELLDGADNPMFLINDAGELLEPKLEAGTLTITPIPTASIAHVSVTEGNSGSTDMTFTVSLDTPATYDIAIDFSTSDGSATTADNDYGTITDSFVIASGQTAATFTVPIIGDLNIESDETFNVTISSTDSVVIVHDTAIGTILNEDIATGTIVGRHTFYNGSSLDGHDATVNASDDSGIAIDKVALLPGQTATFTNYTSYLGGITGVMIDIEGIGDPGAIDVDDFSLKVGNVDDVSTWIDAPAPSEIAVRAIDDDNDTLPDFHRITLAFVEDSIVGKWLAVTVKANTDTGIPADDTFFFGNAPCETGDSSTDAQVTPTDAENLRANPIVYNWRNPADATVVYDFNRDGKVNAFDSVKVRFNYTDANNDLNLITPTIPAPILPASTPPAQEMLPVAYLAAEEKPAVEFVPEEPQIDPLAAMLTTVSTSDITIDSTLAQSSTTIQTMPSSTTAIVEATTDEALQLMVLEDESLLLEEDLEIVDDALLKKSDSSLSDDIAFTDEVFALIGDQEIE